MNLNLLELESQLWVVSEDTSDPWFNYFNWQTQFKLSQNANKFLNNTLPLLFSCTTRLPVDCLLLLPTTNNWTELLRSSWENLNQPSTLVFLPHNLPQEDFYKAWPTAKSDAKINCIQDRP